MKNFWIFPIEKNKAKNEKNSILSTTHEAIIALMSIAVVGNFVTSFMFSLFVKYGFMGLQAGSYIWTCGSAMQIILFLTYFTIGIALCFLFIFILELVLQYVIEGFSFVFRKTQGFFEKVSERSNR